jgi:hypothetical protein
MLFMMGMEHTGRDYGIITTVIVVSFALSVLLVHAAIS